MSRLRTLVAAAGVTLAAVLAAVPAAEASGVIRYAHFQPASLDQPKQAAALAFKSYVEAVTGGALEVEIYPASQLGSGTEVLEGLRLGTIQLAVVHDGPIATLFPPFQIFSIPYLFEDQAMAWAVLDGPFGRDFAEAMRQATGIRLLAFADNGIRHFTNNVRPIRSPADLQGIKMRVQESPIYQTLVSSLGGSPSVVPWAELPGALQQGVVDGQENGVTNILAASLYQYQRYATLDGHVYSLHAYLMNDAFFQGLSDSERQAVLHGIAIARTIHRGITTAQDMNASTLLSQKGVTVTALTPAQIDAFRQLAQPAVRAWVEREVGREWVDRLFAAVAAYKSGPM